MTLTTDSVLNFCQLAVLTCQRASGDKNRVARESWVRLCGTYQSRGGVLTQVEVRRVRSAFLAHGYFLTDHLGLARNLSTLLQHLTSASTKRESIWGYAVFAIRRSAWRCRCGWRCTTTKKTSPECAWYPGSGLVSRFLGSMAAFQ